MIYVLLRDFMQLAEAYVLGIWPFLALSVVGIFIQSAPDAREKCTDLTPEQFGWLCAGVDWQRLSRKLMALPTAI